MELATTSPDKTVRFEGADLEIRAKLGQQSLIIDILKSGACVHRVTVNDAVRRLEHGWIADLFAGEHSVELGALASEAGDYVEGLNISQG
jgi:hypothetical protein